MRRTVLITGAGGYVGRAVVQRLARQPDTFRVVAMDMRETPPELHVDGVAYVTGDVRAPDLAQTLREYDVDCVVHLASSVNPGKDQDRAFAWSVDVQGTENVVQACLATGVAQLIVSSSGAAYGYYADNPAWLCEDDPVRGNPEFAYADHKRQVEERLARTRETHPQLRQLVLRSGTALGAETDNQITALATSSPGDCARNLGSHAAGRTNLAGEVRTRPRGNRTPQSEPPCLLPIRSASTWPMARRSGSGAATGTST